MKTATKKGAASLYVVIFATMLFSVVSVSFVRLMVSEIKRSSEDELSQSAYDSALVGVEDVKAALLQCFRENQDFNTCFPKHSECNGFRDDQGLQEDGSVSIQTTQENGNTEAQSYTCVTIDNKIDHYMSTLKSSNTERVIPIAGTGESASYVTIEWGENNGGTKVEHSNPLNFVVANQGTVTPPVVAVTVVRGDGNASTIVFYPAESGEDGVIDEKTLVNATIGDNDIIQQPYQLNCNSGNGYLCSVRINSSDIQYITLSLPYSDQSTEFSVTKYTEENTPVPFANVLYKIDSTGRANDLLRRVEAYVDLTDQFFPYPEYAVSLGTSDNGNGEGFSKNLYVTTNCWRADPGSTSTCENYGVAN